MAGTGTTTSSIMALIRALRDAPSMAERCAATRKLLTTADAQPAKRKAMAEAGLMGLLLLLYVDIQGHPEAAQFGMLAGNLARTLLDSGTVAARDLERAIRAPEPAQTFAALVLLQVCPS
jgi:hypothetical protein